LIFSITTFRMTTLGIMTLDIMTIGIMTLDIMTLGIMTLIMLSVVAPKLGQRCFIVQAPPGFNPIFNFGCALKTVQMSRILKKPRMAALKFIHPGSTL
jgi:hypothetical protein